MFVGQRDPRIDELPAWAIQPLAEMKREGLLIASPQFLGGRSRPATRYEWAVCVHATAEYMGNCAKDLAGRLARCKGEISPDIRADVDTVKGWPRFADVLLKLEQEFRAELVSLEVDMDAQADGIRRSKDLLIAIPKRCELFPDVPKGHWAADALTELKRAGLVVGYPDGRFGGH